VDLPSVTLDVIDPIQPSIVNDSIDQWGLSLKYSASEFLFDYSPSRFALIYKAAKPQRIPVLMIHMICESVIRRKNESLNCNQYHPKMIACSLLCWLSFSCMSDLKVEGDVVLPRNLTLLNSTCT